MIAEGLEESPVLESGDILIALDRGDVGGSSKGPSQFQYNTEMGRDFLKDLGQQ